MSVIPFSDEAQGIWQIDADYVDQGLACVYLLRQGDRLALVETGTNHTVPHILARIEQLGLTPEHLDYIILTHIHLDHAAGAGALMQLCPNAQLIVHPRGARHMAEPAKLQAGTVAVYGEEQYQALYGELIAVDAARITEADDGFELDFNGRRLSFIDTPGHALHHVCIYDELSGGVFTGDTFGLSYRQLDSEAGNFLFVTTTPVHFDPQAMKTSIERILAFEPQWIYLTHYGRIRPSESNVKQLLDSLQAHVDIALAEKDQPEGRQQRLSAAVLEWLVAAWQAQNPGADVSAARDFLKLDAGLNAQGLEVWLARMESQG